MRRMAQVVCETQLHMHLLPAHVHKLRVLHSRRGPQIQFIMPYMYIYIYTYVYMCVYIHICGSILGYILYGSLEVLDLEVTA